MKKISEFINKNRALIIISWLFLLAFFLRTYRLPGFIAYHQDQVRDLNYVKEFIDQGKIFLLGPKASVGNFYLPPFWYYLMAIGFIFSSSPVMPAFIVVLFSSLTTIVIYKFVNKFLNKDAAFFSALLYAVSNLSIEYSRFAWNPNPIPFFVILTLYFLYEFLFEKKESSLYLGAVTANLAFQLHYQGLVITIFYFLAVLFYKKFDLRKFLYYFLINFLLISPFLIYEYINKYPNTLGIIDFIFHGKANAGLRFFGIPFFIKFILFDFSSFLGKVLFFKNNLLGMLFLPVFLLSLLFKSKDNKINLLKGFLIFSLVMLFVYKNSLIDFYLLFLIPGVIIYFCTLLFNLKLRKISLIFISIIIIVSLGISPAFTKLENTYLSVKNASNYITSKNNYCIVYDIFKTNYIESKFRYLVSLSSNQPKKINCEKILYYQCHPEIKTVFFLCERPKCQASGVDFTLLNRVNLGDLNPGVEVYEFDL